MQLIDWMFLMGPVLVVCAVAYRTRKYVRGVSDFLAAGRTAGRYLVANAEGTAAMGAVTILAIFEMLYKVGGTVSWWQSINTPVFLLITLSGYIIYRYRETRAMTMAEFFERRYSRRFRIFMGSLAWLAGLVNYGIFPVVGANFFVTFLALPPACAIGSVSIPTYMIVMAGLLSLNFTLVTMGGQLTAVVTDCVEGIIGGLFFLLLMIGVLYVFDWEQIASAHLNRPAGESLMNPFNAWKHADFNIAFVIIGLFTNVYAYMAWQGNSGFNASAASPHEAKMGRILGQWRAYARGWAIALLAMGAVTFMHHPEFTSQAQAVNQQVGGIASSAMPPSQTTVPLALREFLPVGLKGMFAAVMLFAIMACDASYMHSWGSILVQDVLLPIRESRGAPKLTAAQHLRWLRRSILFVAVFAFCFGLVYRQNDYLLMFFALTGAIFLGGAGSVIVGGLYWRRGTTTGAWAAMLTGACLAISGIIAQQLFPNFPLNGVWISLITSLSAISVYVIISVVSCRTPHNMDQLLHRGAYAVQQNPAPANTRHRGKWKALLGIDESFSRRDKLQSIVLFCWSMFWFVLFLVVTAWNWIWRWPDAWWGTLNYLANVVLGITLAVITTVWFTWGGARDLSRLFRSLAIVRSNPADNGVVGTPGASDYPAAPSQPEEARTLSAAAAEDAKSHL